MSSQSVPSVEAPQPQRHIMRREEVEQKTGFKRAHIYNLMKEGKFPRAKRIGLRAAIETHLTSPHEPYVLFEVVQVEPTYHFDHDPLLQLSLSLLQEPGQPGALLIALAGEHQR